MAPLPSGVVATGASSSSATSRSSSHAPEDSTPPPATIAGRAASASTSTASRTAAGSGAMRRCGKRRAPGRSPAAVAPSAASTSSGQLTSVGPGRPLVASTKARAVSSETRSGRSRRTAHFVIGRNSARWSTSWMGFRPTIAVFTSFTIATTGIEDAHASASPVIRLVAPGPRMAAHTPGRPLTRAYASAMMAPARSSRTVMGRISARSISAYRASGESRPNTWVTPQARRVS